LAADYRILSGRPWTPVTRNNTIDELNASSFYDVFLEPRGDRRWDASNLLNLRVSKWFDIGSIGGQPARIQAIFDVFNLLNDDSPEAINNFVQARYAISGEAAFGKPSELVLPRRVRLGARFVF
jgi:hypothetical protein